MKRPTISVIHPSTRPAAVAQVHQLWFENASDSPRFSIAIAFHQSQALEFSAARYYSARYGSEAPNARQHWAYLCYPFVVCMSLINTGPNHPTLNGRSSYVDNVNLAAAATTGDIIVLATDDLEPPKLWDQQIIDAIGDPSKEAILRVSHGDPSDDRAAIIHPIMTRARYERQGWFVCPEYSGVFSDNDLAERARIDGVVIAAPWIRFTHHHPLYEARVPSDDWYSWGNSPDEYQAGRAIFNRRREHGFPHESETE